MKVLSFISALILTSFIAKAQMPIIGGSSKSIVTHVSFGVDAGIPTGNLSRAYPKLLGVSLQADVPLSAELFFTANAGYNNMVGHTYQVAQLAGAPAFTSKNVHLVPVKIGLKIFPLNNFYLQAEAGAMLLLNKAEFFNDRAVAVLFAPQLGVQFPLGSRGSFIDTGIRYEVTGKYSSSDTNSAVNFVALRLAYGF